MKKILLLLLMTSLFESTFAMHHRICQKSAQQFPVKYLRRLYKLGNDNKIPQLIVTSIVNNSRYQIWMIKSDVYLSWLNPGEKSKVAWVKYSSRYKHFLESKISQVDKLKGVFERLNFHIAALDEYGYMSQENGGLCHLNLIVNLDDEHDIQQQNIDKLIILLEMNYKNNQDSVWSELEIPYCDCNLIKVVIEINEFDDFDTVAPKIFCTFRLEEESEISDWPEYIEDNSLEK